MTSWAQRIRQGEKLTTVIDEFIDSGGHDGNTLNIWKKLMDETTEDQYLNELLCEFFTDIVYWRMKCRDDLQAERDELDLKVSNWLEAELGV